MCKQTYHCSDSILISVGPRNVGSHLGPRKPQKVSMCVRACVSSRGNLGGVYLFSLICIFLEIAVIFLFVIAVTPI